MRADRVTGLGAGVVAAALLVASCSGDDGDTSEPADDETTAQSASVDSLPVGSVPADDADTEADAGSEAATIDPAAMPDPAEAVLTVDGETIMYAPPDPDDTRLFTCDLGTERITVNLQTPDGHDLLVQVAVVDTGEWAGSIVAKSRDSDRNYQGKRTYASEAFAVDGQYMTFAGPFEYYLEGDPTSFTDAGEAQIAVTCP